MYPRSVFGGEIFVLGSIRFNRGSIDSRFLHINIEYDLLPTISLKLPMNTFVVDTYEGRDVAIFDVPGASFNADMPY